jgi:hypothetical protein
MTFAAEQRNIDKLYAVHATTVFPTDGIICAGFKNMPFSDPLARSLYPDIRNTVHFTIGEVVRPIKVGTTIYAWDNDPYAILIPLNNLMPQLINLNCYDTFTIGTVNVNQETNILVIPEDAIDKIPNQHKYEIWTYNARVNKIREAVDHVIRCKNCWIVRMMDNHTEDVLSPAFIENGDIDIDINNADFFADVKTSHPHISIAGLRWNEFSGEGYLFGVLEQKTMPYIKHLLNGSFEMSYKAVENEYTPEDLEHAIIEIRETAALVDRFVKTAPYLPVIKLEYADKRFELDTWLNILSVEIELNREAKKTLKGAPKEVWQLVDDIRDDYNTLRDELFFRADQLNDSKVFAEVVFR